MKWLLLPGYIALQVFIVWVFFLIVRHSEKRTVKRCTCGKRCYTLYVWRRNCGVMREPFFGIAHSDNHPCFPIPEENNLNPTYRGGTE